MTFLTGTILLAVVTALACAIPGAFVVLRRNSMLVDAISHAVLPGIVVGYFFTRDLDSPLLILGAALSGLLVVLGSEWLTRTGLLTGDAPQGLVFPALFSAGVILVTLNFANVHLDVHAVLVGDLNLAAFEHVRVGGVSIGPGYLYVMLAVLVVNAAFVALWYPKLTVLAFDPPFAAALGIRTRLLGTAFMFLVSVTVTAAFHAAGAILVIALVVVPAATALLLTRRLSTLLALTAVFAAGGALAGFWVAYALDAATSAGMAVLYGIVFLLVFAGVRLRRRLRLGAGGRRGDGRRAPDPAAAGGVTGMLSGRGPSREARNGAGAPRPPGGLWTRGETLSSPVRPGALHSDPRFHLRNQHGLLEISMKIRYAIPALAAAAVLTLTGCVNNAESEGGGTSDADAAAIEPDQAAVDLLPDDLRESGVLRIGTDAEYPPNEYKNAEGEPVGWGVDLAEAVSAKLGLEPDWEILGFDSIMPRIEEGALDMGSSSFTDTLERQKTVDFVNFLNAGSQWAAPVGSDVDPEDACGLTVAVQQGTVQHTDELPAKSEACEADGKPAIEILPFDGQPEATNAVVNGQADAFSADLPVTGDAVSKLSDELETVGDVFDAAPYGFATPKGSEITKAVQAALQSLMDDGTYLEILEGAGVEAGALESATVNAGTE